MRRSRVRRSAAHGEEERNRLREIRPVTIQDDAPTAAQQHGKDDNLAQRIEREAQPRGAPDPVPSGRDRRPIQVVITEVVAAIDGLADVDGVVSLEVATVLVEALNRKERAAMEVTDGMERNAMNKQSGAARRRAFLSCGTKRTLSDASAESLVARCFASRLTGRWRWSRCPPGRGGATPACELLVLASPRPFLSRRSAAAARVLLIMLERTMNRKAATTTMRGAVM